MPLDRCQCGEIATVGDLCFECMEDRLTVNLTTPTSREHEVSALDQAMEMLEDGDMDDMSPEHWDEIHGRRRKR